MIHSMAESLDTKIFLEMNGWTRLGKAANTFWRGSAFLAPFIFVVLCLWMLYGDPNAVSHFVRIAIAAIISQIIARVIRLFWHRKRPYLNKNIATNKLLHKGDEAAFPSAHSSSLFAVAVSVAVFNPVFGSVLIALAALNAVARTVTGMHYPSDVLAGAILGTVVGLIV